MYASKKSPWDDVTIQFWSTFSVEGSVGIIALGVLFTLPLLSALTKLPTIEDSIICPSAPFPPPSCKEFLIWSSIGISIMPELPVKPVVVLFAVILYLYKLIKSLFKKTEAFLLTSLFTISKGSFAGYNKEVPNSLV